MNERQATIQEIRAFNYGWKDIEAKKIFGKPYSELSREQQIDIDDMILERKE